MSNNWDYGDIVENDSPISSQSPTAPTPQLLLSSSHSNLMSDDFENNSIHHDDDYDYEYDTIYATKPQHQLNNNNNNNNKNHNKLLSGKQFNLSTSVYDTQEHPFEYDRSRGYWAMTCDFYFACTSHMLNTTLLAEETVYAFYQTGFYYFPVYLLAMTLFAIPTFLIQTFLGQFSSSGLISAFRVVPIFKGLGYSMLAANLISLTYSSVKVAIPLVYAANTLHNVLPWMHCDNPWNTPNCTLHSDYDVEFEGTIDYHSVIEFFRYIIRTDKVDNSNWDISWPIFFAVLSIWLLVLGIMLKRISFIGKMFRCISIILLCFFVTIFVYTFINLGITYKAFISYFNPAILSMDIIQKAIPAVFLTTTASLGPGLGNIITLASYNNFRRDSEKLTYWVYGTSALLTLIISINGVIAWDHFEDHVGLFHYQVEENHSFQYIYLCYAYLFGSFTNLPNFWSFLFFSMLFLAELCAVVIQMMTVLTAIFDEFSQLRKSKTIITIALVLVMMLSSVYFCTKIGFVYLTRLLDVVILMHVIVWIMLLLVTTWIYGRDRFQCDLQFMLGKTISSFKIFLIRFVAPTILIVSIYSLDVRLENKTADFILLLIIQSVVYVCTPVYMIYKVCRTTSSWLDRKRQCLKPHDWHPIDIENRRFYEEIMGISEMLVIDHGQQCLQQHT